MTHIYLIPKWFFGIDIFLELSFALVTFLVSFYAYKIYLLTNQREAKIFGIGFFFISLSYIIWGVLNLFLAVQINEYLRGLDFTSLGAISILNNAAIYSHFILHIAGLVALAYVTSKFRNKRAFFMILAISLIGIVLSSDISRSFYLISSVLLGVIFYHYYNDLYIKGNNKIYKVFSAFGFLLFGTICFLFNGGSYYFYVLGHILSMIGYIFILSNLVILGKNGKKTR